MRYKHRVQQHGKVACCWKICRRPIRKTQSRTAHSQKAHPWTQRLRLRLVEQVPHIRTKLPPGQNDCAWRSRRWLRYKGGGADAGGPPGWFLAFANESHGVPNQTPEPAKIGPTKKSGAAGCCGRRWLLAWCRWLLACTRRWLLAWRRWLLAWSRWLLPERSRREQIWRR